MENVDVLTNPSYDINYRQASYTRRIKPQILNVFHLVLQCLCTIRWSQVLSQNDDAVGAVLTGEAPTTSK